MDARGKALSVVILDLILACLLIISFVIDCTTMGSQNVPPKKRVAKGKDGLGAYG